MSGKALVRGRDVTTVLCALWSFLFAGLGIATMLRTGPYASLRWFDDLKGIDVRRALQSGSLSSLNVSGYALGMLELCAGALLLLAAVLYVVTRRPDPDADRVNPAFSLIPIAAAFAAVFFVTQLGAGQPGALFVPGYLAVAAAASLFITPALMTIWGVPADRSRILAALKQQQAIHASNWHSARR